MAKSLPPDDPAQWMLNDEFTSKPVVHKDGCYICEDPEFAQMGLPLCYPCLYCGGHVAADGTICDKCGKEQGNLDMFPACKTCVFREPDSGFCPKRKEVMVEDHFCFEHEMECKHCGHFPCGCGG